MAASDDGFLTRWSRRKAHLREGTVAAEAPVVVPLARPAANPPLPAPLPSAPTAGGEPPQALSDATTPADPPPTLADVAQLTRESHFGRFVKPDVEPAVKNAALKKLFADPQFNVMDGLDTYIDDYGKPDPLPAHLLRKMVQAKFLGLIDEEEVKDGASPPADAPVSAASNFEAPASEPLPHEDTDLRLQPHDAAGCAGAEPGAGQHGGGEH